MKEGKIREFIGREIEMQFGSVRKFSEDLELSHSAVSRYLAGGDITIQSLLLILSAIKFEITLTPKN